MALTRVIIVFFAVLVNLAFTSAAAFNGENKCWNMAIKISGCGDDAGFNPDFCLCRSAGIETIFTQLKEYCAQNGHLNGVTPEQVCANLLHPHEAGRAVTTLAASTTVAAPAKILSHKTWETPGFCALPGTFCSFEEDVAEEAELPTVITRADIGTLLGATPSFKNPRPYGLPWIAPAYQTTAPVKRSDDEGVLPLQADTMGNGADSKVMGGLKIALGFVIGWMAALMVI